MKDNKTATNNSCIDDAKRIGTTATMHTQRRRFFFFILFFTFTRDFETVA